MYECDIVYWTVKLVMLHCKFSRNKYSFGSLVTRLSVKKPSLQYRQASVEVHNQVNIVDDVYIILY